MVNKPKPELTLLQEKILRILFKKAGKELNQKQIADLALVILSQNKAAKSISL